jgi:hypothetical protein
MPGRIGLPSVQHFFLELGGTVRAIRKATVVVPGVWVILSTGLGAADGVLRGGAADGVLRGGAADGVLIVQRTTTGAGAPQTNQVQIEKNRMRTEVTDQSGAKQVVVFDGGKQTMFMINLDKKTYSEITKADIDRMSDMMSQMQAQLAALPAEQRAMAESMMKGRGGAMGAAAKTEYKKTGTDKVGKWTCDKYEGSRNGQKTSELCTVDPAALGFTAADFAVTQQFMEFFGKLLPQAADQAFGLGQAAQQGFSGVPVRAVVTGPMGTTTSEVTEASRQTFADSMFAVPAGFQKIDMMGMGGRRGRQ